MALRLSSYCWNTESIFFLIAWRKISEWQGQKQNFLVYWSLYRNRLAWFTVGTSIAYSQWYVLSSFSVGPSTVLTVWFSRLFSTCLELNIFHLKEQKLVPLILMNCCYIYKFACSYILLFSLPSFSSPYMYSLYSLLNLYTCY